MTPIQVYMPAGEAREGKMRAAIEADKQGRFAWGGNSSELPGDVRFCLSEQDESAPSVVYIDAGGDVRTAPAASRRTLDVEIKDFTGEGNSDYLASILNGHLWDQVTRAAAYSYPNPYVVCVLGDDNDVGAAIRKAASRNHRMDPKKLMQYYEMVEGFEANCIARGAQVWRLKTDPYGRLLLRARKILEGGNLDGFCPKPADGERQAVGLSILAGRGVGPKMARNILERYQLCLILRDGYCGDLVDCEGIGPKRAETIKKNIEVMDG